jgi:F420-dependent oxidoreductase-like protein
MRLSLQLPNFGARELADRAGELERAGLDIIWVAETYGFDAPSLMGYVAARTEHLLIGSSILPIYTRTPELLADTAAGLDLVSGGRAILGLGVSGPQVIEGWHGVPWQQPVKRTRAVVETCRLVWQRGPAPDGGNGHGQSYLRGDIPVYVGALGPANVEMTAEIADGWLSLFYVPELAQATWGEALARGAARRSAQLGRLEIVAGGAAALETDLELARKIERSTLALYFGGMGARGQNFYSDVLRRWGYLSEAERIQDLYLSGHKAEAEAAVPDEIVNGQSLLGSESHVKDRIRALRDSGVTVLNLLPIGRDPVALVSQFKAWMSES